MVAHIFGEVILGDQPLTPVEVERQIRETTERLERGVEIVRERNRILKDCERLLKREKAMVYMQHRSNGLSIKDADAQTVIDTDPAHNERDQAEVAYWYARDLMVQLQNKLSALQTQAAGLRTAYPLAGRGLP
ncbi:hypothetical protein CDES_07690 [Corynebacterium deserti GIMN1.010]|uniref:Uncharacterized protein n=1 Tax=Corynebacterium deserti GIMN1.010 TaxID=931089 RepID=A0A0M4CLZ9_9CORY|nr:hypothetical protein [Corynebacterium deserti]ALC05947.1 hypothetical protein CDES_07690 [Corynebacterium deserti GIMN1.010]